MEEKLAKEIANNLYGLKNTLRDIIDILKEEKEKKNYVNIKSR